MPPVAAPHAPHPSATSPAASPPAPTPPAAAAAADGDPAVIPPDGFHTGWTRSEPLRVFKGADLYGHIDGGAESFLELGFDVLTLQRFRKGDEEVVLEVYRMDDPVAAWGIYLAKCGKETPDPSFHERHTAGRYQLAFVKGRDYVLVTNDAGTPEAAKLLLEIARFVASRLPASGEPAILHLLPMEGLVPGSARLVCGPFGLQPVAGSLGVGDFLLLGGKVTAVAGDYRQQQSGPRTLMIADYPSPVAAAAAFAHLRSVLDPALRVLSSTDARIVLQAPSGSYGVVSRGGARITVDMDLAGKPEP